MILPGQKENINRMPLCALRLPQPRRLSAPCVYHNYTAGLRPASITTMTSALTREVKVHLPPMWVLVY
jgi:hypothetical protein